MESQQYGFGLEAGIQQGANNMAEQKVPSSHEETKLTTIYRAITVVNDQRLAKKFNTICNTTITKLQHKYKEGTTTKQGAGDNRVKTPTPKWGKHKQEDNKNCRDSSQNGRGLSPTVRYLAKQSCTCKMKTQNKLPLKTRVTDF